MSVTNTIIELTRNEDRDSMLCEIYKNCPEYKKAREEHRMIYDTIKSNISNDVDTCKLLMNMDDKAAFLEALVMDAAYEKGIQDGVNFIMDCLLSKGMGRCL